MTRLNNCGGRFRRVHPSVLQQRHSEERACRATQRPLERIAVPRRSQRECRIVDSGRGKTSTSRSWCRLRTWPTQGRRVSVLNGTAQPSEIAPSAHVRSILRRSTRSSLSGTGTHLDDHLRQQPPASARLAKRPQRWPRRRRRGGCRPPSTGVGPQRRHGGATRPGEPLEQVEIAAPSVSASRRGVGPWSRSC